MTNTEAPRIIESRERDKYGRTVYRCGTEWCKTDVVICVLPKFAADNHHDGNRYMINDWRMPVWENGVYVADAPGKMTYVRTLKQARAVVAAKLLP